MKNCFLIVSFVSLFSLPALGEDQLPKRPDFARYSAMLSHSPFAIATAPVQAPTTPSWSKDLYIGNAARTPDADLITVLSGADKNLHEYLSTAETNSHGYSVANIQWSDNQGETKATISKDGQYATIGFNQALVTTSSAPMPQPNIAPPGAPGPNVPYMPKPIPATAATPTPHMRGIIERNPRVPAQPAMATPFVPPQ